MAIWLEVKVDSTSLREQLSKIDERVDKAMLDATQESIKIISADVAAKILGITKKGVFWDIDSDATAIPHGAQGYVRTPHSRPHIIEPHPPNKYLHFRVDGQWVMVKVVNHPGSNPVDWLTPFAEQSHEDIFGVYEEKVGAALGFGGGNASTPRGGVL